MVFRCTCKIIYERGADGKERGRGYGFCISKGFTVKNGATDSPCLPAWSEFFFQFHHIADIVENEIANCYIVDILVVAEVLCPSATANIHGRTIAIRLLAVKRSKVVLTAVPTFYQTGENMNVLTLGVGSLASDTTVLCQPEVNLCAIFLSEQGRVMFAEKYPVLFVLKAESRFRLIAVIVAVGATIEGTSQYNSNCSRCPFISPACSFFSR